MISDVGFVVMGVLVVVVVVFCGFVVIGYGGYIFVGG